MPERILDTLKTARELAEAAAAPGQPQPLYSVMDRRLGEILGHTLFTILSYRTGAADVERVYSSRPADFPLRGRKPMGRTPWGELVLEAGQPWAGDSADDIRWAFPDHELILSLGCRSCLNVPVRHDGRVLGVVNVLAGPGVLRESDLDLVTPFAAYLVPALDRSTPATETRHE